ncbi:MAG TPA: transglycosylase domain-containing protein [Polyangia bacterium]|nr:transglycosylase domain-containing protein [Polyangia bacterium]
MRRSRPRLRRALAAALLAGCGLAGLAFQSLAVAVLAVPYPVERLAPEAGGPLVILDRRGEVLRRVPAEDGCPGREDWVPLDRIRSHAVLTLVQSEDERFFEHAGVDPVGLVRAAWLDLRERRLGYGGSTITMQLMRMVHNPGEPRTLANKIEEAVLALRLERAMGKREILEHYLNRAYFGRGAHGIEAAARTYFGKPAAALGTGEATLLGVLPRGPSLYDPIRNPGRAVARRDHVLALMVSRGVITPAEVTRAQAEIVEPALHGAAFTAPHFADWVLSGLPAEVRRRGGTVTTTLDLELQRLLEHRVREHVAGLAPGGLGQAGLVVLDTATGEVLAMIGSPDYEAEDGQLNITTRRRHPGSALKPFVYALALEAGASPATVAYDIADVESRYEVARVTQPERGPVRLREALAGSYNLAAIHVLEQVGEERLVTRLRQAGVGGLPGDPADYGLRLALGATRVRLLDLAAGYGFLARGGTVTRPVGVRRVELARGGDWRPPVSAPRRIFSAEVSWLVLDMLADPAARRPAFGQELPVDDMPFEVAIKTGTSRGFSNTVAVGVTEQLTVAAWAGNFDGRPTKGLVAMDAAAPLVREGMLLAARGGKPTLPKRPQTLVSDRICPLSGMLAGPDCPHGKVEHFAPGTAPAKTCDWHERHGDEIRVRYPTEIARWAARTRHAGGRGI